jgi:hypothetical protein
MNWYFHGVYDAMTLDFTLTDVWSAENSTVNPPSPITSSWGLCVVCYECNLGTFFFTRPQIYSDTLSRTHITFLKSSVRLGRNLWLFPQDSATAIPCVVHKCLWRYNNHHSIMVPAFVRCEPVLSIFTCGACLMIQPIVITLALKGGRRGGKGTFGMYFQFHQRKFNAHWTTRVCKPKGIVSRTFCKCGNNLRLTAILWIHTRGIHTHLRHLTDGHMLKIKQINQQDS